MLSYPICALALSLLLVAMPAASVGQSRVLLGAVEAAQQQPVLALTGELQALRRSVLSAEVAGPADRVLVERGDDIEAGAVLAGLRRQPAQFVLRAARGRAAQAAADVDRAAINERRLGRLLQRKAASQDEYDAAQVELNKARAILSTRRAEVEQALDQLARHSLIAPYAGVVIDRHVEVGQWLDIGDPCFTVADLSRVRAVLTAPQQYYERIQVGGEVVLRLEALPGEAFHTRITRKLPRVKRQGRSFEIWMELANEGRRLVAGFSVRAQLALTGAGRGVVKIPRDAVLRSPDGSAWFWLAELSSGIASKAQPKEAGSDHRGGPGTEPLPERDAGRAAPEPTYSVRKVMVEVIGAAGRDLMVRGKNLTPGDLAVVRGNERLREGQQVVRGHL